MNQKHNDMTIGDFFLFIIFCVYSNFFKNSQLT